jgi:serine/tyrosine/threonine adenylyltransferase
MLTQLVFDNRFVRDLPGDPDTSAERRQVLHACWSVAPPTPVAAPRLLAHAHEVATQLGVTPDVVTTQVFADVFGGNVLLDGMTPFAACYGGHQFGHWAGQLGDGRAISLGEVITPAGERCELQLKGAGPTPYSRTADGRAVLRSSLREFLCGDAKLEPGAIVCRVAPSFIRFGNFELLTARGDLAVLETLVDFTIDRDFPHIVGTPGQRRAQWFTEVCERTAEMIVHWMRVGFVHGVMNTDNMSILGLTIDYGPYGWLDNYDPDWTPNTTDAGGRRYRYGQQPAVAQWNLVQLATAIAPLFTDTAPLQAALDRYLSHYRELFTAMTCAKFGFLRNDDAIQALMAEAYELLQACELDYTRFFRALGDLPAELPSDSPVVALLGDITYDEAKLRLHGDALDAWVRRWHASLAADDSHVARRDRMHRVNPRYVFRNYLAQQAIDLAEAGDTSMLHTLHEVLRRPYDEQPKHQIFAARRPDWARDKAGCSMLSCSS